MTIVPGQQTGRPAWLGPQGSDRVETLFVELRRIWPSITAEQITAASDLLVYYSNSGRLPGSPEGLADLLTPVFATNPAEQRGISDEIIKILGSTPKPRGEVARRQRVPTRGRVSAADIDEAGGKRGPLTLESAWALAVLIVTASIIAVIVYFAPRYESVGPCKDCRGSSLKVPPPPKNPRPSPLKPPDVSNAGTVKPDDIEIVLNDAPFTAPFVTVRLVLTTLPISLVLIGAGLAFFRRRDQLRRAERIDADEIGDVHAPGMEEALHGGRSFSEAIRKIRHRFHVQTRRVDVDKTVDAIARAGSKSELRFAEQAVQPEYLFLIEQSGGGDQLTELFLSLARKFDRDHVNVIVYLFQGDPTYCHLPDYPDRKRRLDRILAQLPGCRVLIASGNPSLLDPVHPARTKWLLDLELASVKMLFTPRPLEEWGRMEHVFIANSFAVLPATSNGLDITANYIETLYSGYGHTEPPLPARMRSSVSLPEGLVRNQAQWLYGATFTETELDDLTLDLEIYFSLAGAEHGLDWLSACAIFPNLHWSLTTFFGSEISAYYGKTQLNHDAMLALVRLPWFRHGKIPDPVRLHLLERLSKDLSDALRSAAHKLVAAALPGAPLITLDPGGKLTNDQQRAVLDYFNHLPSDAELRDGVFLNFARGKEQVQSDINELPQSDFARDFWWFSTRATLPIIMMMALGLGIFSLADNAARFADIEIQQPIKLSDAINDQNRWINEGQDGGRQMRLDSLKKPIEKADMSRLRLENAQLTNTTFSNVSFVGTDFRNADLTGSKFINCDFSYANFSNATLLNTEFTDSSFRRAVFGNALMSGASFTGSDLRRAVFSKEVSPFDGSRLADNVTMAQTILIEVDLTPHVLSGLDLNTVDLTDATLTDQQRADLCARPNADTYLVGDGRLCDTRQTDLVAQVEQAISALSTLAGQLEQRLAEYQAMPAGSAQQRQAREQLQSNINQADASSRNIVQLLQTLEERDPEAAKKLNGEYEQLTGRLREVQRSLQSAGASPSDRARTLIESLRGPVERLENLVQAISQDTSNAVARAQNALTEVARLEDLENNVRTSLAGLEKSESFAELNRDLDGLDTRIQRAGTQLRQIIQGSGSGARTAVERGMSADQIGRLQDVLCLSSGNNDGKSAPRFDAATRNAISLYQAARGERRTGQINNQSQLAFILRQTPCSGSRLSWSNAFERFTYPDTASIDSHKLLLESLFTFLAEDGGSINLRAGGSAQGIDPQTRNVIEALQEAVRRALPASEIEEYQRRLRTGEITPEFLVALDRWVAATWKQRIDQDFAEAQSDDDKTRREARSKLTATLTAIPTDEQRGAAIQYLVGLVDPNNARGRYRQAIGVFVALGGMQNGWIGSGSTRSQLESYSEFSKEDVFQQRFREAMSNFRPLASAN